MEFNKDSSEDFSDEEFIDFGIPLEELHQILNVAEIPEEWAESQPQWDGSQDFTMNSSEIMSETSQIFAENPLGDVQDLQARNDQMDIAGPSGMQNRKRPRNDGQMTGAGAEEEEDGENSKYDEAIILREKMRRPNRKYSAEEIALEARIDFDRLPNAHKNVSVAESVSLVQRLFESIIRRVTEGLAPQDLIRICLLCDKLDKPTSTGLMRVSEMTVEKLMSSIMKVLQSKDEILLDENFSLDVVIVQRPVGSGRGRRVVNMDVDRLKKQSIITIETKEDHPNLCCAQGIMMGKACLENDPELKTLMNKRCDLLIRRALHLHATSGVPEGPCGFDEISIFEDFLDIQIVVFSTENMLKVSYKSRDRPKRINLLLHQGHFDVIKSLKGFFASDFYCLECEAPYNAIGNHLCKNSCFICRSSSCAKGDTIRCENCDRLCRSPACYETHKNNGICNEIYQCRKCTRIIRWRDCPKELHVCGTSRCPSCSKFVKVSEHRCFLGNKKPLPPNDNLIFFDLETDQSSGEHFVNYAIAQYSDGTTFAFEGYEALKKFCTFLFVQKHKGFTVIAHNMKGFDGQFIVGWLIHQGKEPEIIPNGSKIMQINVRELNIRIIDSFNFLPMALSKLPKTFGLEELQKGYFPHHFNKPGNQNYIGNLPPAQDYSPDGMSPSERAIFMEWYEERKESSFDFKKEMDLYCRSDVDILRRCSLEFRKQFLDVTGIDPFCYVTIAAACMAVYRSRHIKANTIAMVPLYGYCNTINYSMDSIRWLDFVAESEEISINHALNGSGEIKIENHFVDGFCQPSKTVYQYHGCFFHGCLKCFDGDLENPLTRTKMFELNEKTNKITTLLRSKGYIVIEKWEHDFHKEKKENDTLKEFLRTHDVQDRLNPRDAFFGGRTNAIQLYYEGEAKYVDFTSLYPWTNKYCRYPVGHPTVITQDFETMDKYFGFVRCKIAPPRKLYHPVLPARIGGKLLFPLCRICAEKLEQGSCGHPDHERALIGTWVTEEVKKALEKGYKILKIYEVYHFHQSSEDLFKSYINMFLKIKQEASGWPADCVSEEEKNSYIEDYKNNEGIFLDPTAVDFNPGRRQVAKLALNSFWGRWGMNVNKMRLKYVSSLADFNKTMSDRTIEIVDLYLPTPEVAAIQFRRKSAFVEQDASTNVFIAAFTTCYARLKLYNEIDRLDTAVLYMDTDSIIYATNGQNDPPLGNNLGEFTDELNGETIETFVSGGPKNYCYKTNTGKTVTKIRGFSLNFRNSQLLNYDSVSALVKNLDQSMSIPIINPTKITRDVKRRKVINKEEIKLYRMVYTKRRIVENYKTLPYGF